MMMLSNYNENEDDIKILKNPCRSQMTLRLWEAVPMTSGWIHICQMMMMRMVMVMMMMIYLMKVWIMKISMIMMIIKRMMIKTMVMTMRTMRTMRTLITMMTMMTMMTIMTRMMWQGSLLNNFLALCSFSTSWEGIFSEFLQNCTKHNPTENKRDICICVSNEENFFQRVSSRKQGPVG